MTTTPKLTDTQLILLSSAARHEDQLVSLPETLKGGAAKASVSKLLSLELVQEMPVRADEPRWRKDENDHPIGLKITRAGLLAIGIEPDDLLEEEQEAAAEDSPSEGTSTKPGQTGEGSGPAVSWSPREGTKQARVLSILSRPEGASIDDLISATGWLPHTTRAALTGLRQKGYIFIRSKNETGQTVYRTENTEPAAAAGEPVASDAA